MDRDPEYLADIIELGELVNTAVGTMSEAEFLADDVVQDAVAFRVLHIGERCGKLSATLRARHPEVPWPKIIALRNLLAHDYSIVEPAIIWRVVEERLPALIRICVQEASS